VVGRYRESVEGTPFGRYRLIELLGRGGMGEVWRAYDTTIDRVVALKMLLPHYAQDPAFEARFRREARAAARLNDPHVVPIHDVGEIDGRLYVTMRLIEGADLQTLIGFGPLGAERAVHVIEQIASALNDAHQAGLVHRDVKPSNILVAQNDFAYLIDFGIARAADETGLTSEGSTIGTWAYMAPERFRTGDIEPSSDVYALACVLYQCLTGELPFPGTTLEQVAVGHMVMPPPRPSEERDTVPIEFDEVIATGLAKQTADRYHSTVELAAAARHAITDHANRPHPPSAPPSQHSPSPPMAYDPTQTLPPRAKPQPGQANTAGRDPASDTQATVTTPTPAPPSPPPVGPAPPSPPQTPPAPVPGPRGRRRGVLIGALIVVALLVVTGAVVVGVELTGHRDTAAAPATTQAATGVHFSGTYRADYGPGTDLQGKPIPGAAGLTANWGVRSTCGAGGCTATASIIGGSGLLLVSNLVFDDVGGSWVAVGLASAQCNNAPAEIWVVFTLQPRADGTLSGETSRAATNSGCVVERSVTFTRTGDADLATIPDPASLPPRTTSPAQTLHGRYHESLTFTNGTTVPGQDDLSVATNCLRTGDRCMSLFHAPDGVVTLVFGGGKWTRNEAGTVACPSGGTAQVTLTAQYPLPDPLQDPIQQLTGKGNQGVATTSSCNAGGDFVDEFVRTGD
jgi:serine/threonine protein kinase